MELAVMVSRVLPIARYDVKVRAVLTWRGDKPSPVELAGLRKVVPEFRDRGLLDVVETIKHKSSWELGVFPRPYALGELTILANKNGLTLELVEVGT